jgi:cell division protein ZipA
MGELRWVLLGLGAIVMLAIYVWGRGFLGRLAKVVPRPQGAVKARKEPLFDSEGDSPTEPGSEDSPAQSEPVAVPQLERVITLRFIPRDEHLTGDRAVLALRKVGLRHGRYGIFHMHVTEAEDDSAAFSVANLTEPGSFDLNKLSETKIPGMSFFMVLPGVGDPVSRFDQMVDVARSLARTLDADLHDEKGSSWSVQRERYVREEMIEYRHQLNRSMGVE